MSAPSIDSLFARHVEERVKTTERSLSETGFDRLLIHSGRPFVYFADDNEAPFHSNPHFAHWAPVEGPGHLLELVPGQRPRLVRLVPRDFWYAPPAPPPNFVREAFDIVEVATSDEAWKGLSKANGKPAFVGEPVDEARAHGIAEEGLNPAPFVARLDWERSYKSDYEVETLAEANVKGAKGHRAAAAAFEAGASEMEMHHAFLAAVGDKEEALPYPTIIGLDSHAATLHYHGKRGRDGARGRVLLIDAGASVRGYGSDITRTFAAAGVDPAFARLLAGMKTAQRRLAEAAKPGTRYPDLHVQAHRLIAELLSEVGVLRVSADEAYARGLTRPFFPHGLGHFLGIQVHDVAGKQADREGNAAPPPPEFPSLRTLRTIEKRQVFTIEPGLYFIPMLLAPHREGDTRDAFDWKLVDRLTPFGGIRIEDNLYIGPASNRNLTRETLPD